MFGRSRAGRARAVGANVNLTFEFTFGKKPDRRLLGVHGTEREVRRRNCEKVQSESRGGRRDAVYPLVPIAFVNVYTSLPSTASGPVNAAVVISG